MEKKKRKPSKRKPRKPKVEVIRLDEAEIEAVDNLIMEMRAPRKPHRFGEFVIPANCHIKGWGLLGGE